MHTALRVLVTGGAGFVGSHLCTRLLNHQRVASVRVIDNLSTGKRSNIESILPQIEFVEGDLNDGPLLQKALGGIDVVFHVAAIPSVPRSVKEPVQSHLNGSHMTLLLLDAAVKAGVRRVIYSASSSAYGDTPSLPKTESMLPRPKSPYAATKLAGEHYMKVFAECYPIDTCSLRYFNIFGPRQDPQSPYSGVLARFCTAYCNGDPMMIHGDGEQSRDFTYVDNAVDANILAMQRKDDLHGDVFNIACGERVTLNEVVSKLNEITGHNRLPEHGPARPGDVKHSMADISKAGEELGYIPLVSFREGLSKTLEWYRNNPDRNDT